MEGETVDLGQQAGRAQQLNQDPPPETSYPDLHDEFLAAAIGTMNSLVDMSAQILNNPNLSQKLLGELVPLIYKGLKATA